MHTTSFWRFKQRCWNVRERWKHTTLCAYSGFFDNISVIILLFSSCPQPLLRTSFLRAMRSTFFAIYPIKIVVEKWKRGSGNQLFAFLWIGDAFYTSGCCIVVVDWLLLTMLYKKGIRNYSVDPVVCCYPSFLTENWAMGREPQSRRPPGGSRR